MLAVFSVWLLVFDGFTAVTAVTTAELGAVHLDMSSSATQH